MNSNHWNSAWIRCINRFVSFFSGALSAHNKTITKSSSRDQRYQLQQHQTTWNASFTPNRRLLRLRYVARSLSIIQFRVGLPRGPCLLTKQPAVLILWYADHACSPGSPAFSLYGAQRLQRFKHRALNDAQLLVRIAPNISITSLLPLLHYNCNPKSTRNRENDDECADSGG